MEKAPVKVSPRRCVGRREETGRKKAQLEGAPLITVLYKLEEPRGNIFALKRLTPESRWVF